MLGRECTVLGRSVPCWGGSAGGACPRLLPAGPDHLTLHGLAVQLPVVVDLHGPGGAQLEDTWPGTSGTLWST